MPIHVALLILLLLPFSAEAQTQAPRKLSLSAAIEAALENNAEVGISEQQQIQAKARMEEQRSTLLPNLNGLISHTDQTINLGSRGLDFPGIPHRAGPFGNTEMRFQFSEPFDIALIRRYQSSKHSANSSQFETEAVKHKVEAMVAKLYFGVQAASALVDAAQSQIDLDQSLLQLARDRLQVGSGTQLDVTRAQARLTTERYHLLQAQNSHRNAELQLLRAMGEPLDIQVELTDPLEAAAPVTTVEEALGIAMRNRPELMSEERKLQAARLTFAAARAELFPSIQSFADYGNSGNPGSSFIPTRTIGIQLNIPLFDAGRRAAHRKRANSQLRQAEIHAKDVRDAIELEVRLAVDNLASAREQLEAADQSLRLAEEELELSRLRFEAQVSTQLDVITGQAEVADARSRHVNALFAVKSAEIEYRRATGLEIQE